MKTIGLIALFGALVLAIRQYVRTPPKGTLEDAVRDNMFRSLVLVGVDGSYVYFKTMDRGLITLTRRGNGRWTLEAAVSRCPLPAAFFDDVAARIDLFEHDLELQVLAREAEDDTERFVVQGQGLQDADAVERLALSIFQCMGRPSDELYRYSFEGPRDWEAVHESHRRFVADIKARRKSN